MMTWQVDHFMLIMLIMLIKLTDHVISHFRYKTGWLIILIMSIMYFIYVARCEP